MVIPKDAPLPVQRGVIVTTTKDGQDNIGLIITLGERPQAEENFQLSRIRLDDIEPGPKGVAKVRLVFRGFTNGLWAVGVQYREGVAEQQLSIIPSSGFSREELDRIQEKAMKYVMEHIPAEEATLAFEEAIPLPAI